MVAALTESLDRELRSESSVAVSLICPGAVSTAIGASDDGTESSDRPVEADELAFRELFADLVAKGESADELAAEIFAGIRAGHFWIIPKSVALSRLRNRSDDIVSGR